MAIPLEGSRLKILAFIQKQGSATVDEIGQELKLSPATIRRHLDILRADRLVFYDQVRKKAGRPEFLYFLTEEGYESGPRGYKELLTLFLDEVTRLDLKDVEGKEGVELLQLLIARISSQVSKPYVESGQSSPEARLARLEQALTDSGFSPEITQEDREVQIRLCNCPFRASALGQKLVCRFDLEIIANVLGVDAVCQYTIHDGSSTCCYSATLGV